MNGQFKLGDVVLKNWTLSKLLGRDTAGSVYEATQNVSGQVNKAAIKVITIPQSINDIKDIMADGMDKNSVIEYFRGSIGDLLEEFLLMTDLKGCRNIVNYDDHQVVQHTEGIGWDIILRMELLTPLVDYAHVKPLSRENVIQLGIDICYALEHCAEYNIVHRDIKPGNIFISKKGEFMLGDFGIARTLDKTAGGFTKNAYTAPELYRGEQYDETVDIYSLGIVLYRLLNMNRTPFMPDYPTPITHNSRELAFSKQLRGVKVPPPKNADGQLANVVLRACAFKPEDRYTTATQMREDLEAVLTGKAISQPPPPTHYFESPTITASAKSPVFDYDEPESSGFYSILKERATEKSHEATDFAENPFVDTGPIPPRVPVRKEPSISNELAFKETPYKESSYKDSSYRDSSYKDSDQYDSPPQTRQFDYEEDLYDSGTGSVASFLAPILEFLKERLAFIGIVGVAVFAIIIAVLVLNPFNGDPTPIEPEEPLNYEEPPPPQIQSVRVPDFRGSMHLDVLTNERFIDVFTFVIDHEYSDYVPEGDIIRQSPEANYEQPLSPLGERIRVSLIVSLGPEPSPFDDITRVTVMHGQRNLPGRTANPPNPGFTLRLGGDNTIVLTARVEPLDFPWAEIYAEYDDYFEGYIEWISTNEDVFVVTTVNRSDNSARITATGTGSATLLVRVGGVQDRVIVTVNN